MVIRFSFSIVGKETWLKSTISGIFCCLTEGLFSLKLVLRRAWTTDLTLCERCPTFDWATVFLTGGSAPAPRKHTYCCTFVSSLHFTCNSFSTSFLVAFWGVVESSLLLSSYNSDCTSSVLVQWTLVAFSGIVVIPYDYWKFYICYATRAGFRSRKISQSPYGYKRRRSL